MSQESRDGVSLHPTQSPKFSPVPDGHLTGLKNDSKWRMDKGNQDQCDEGYEGEVQGVQEELTGS